MSLAFQLRRHVSPLLPARIRRVLREMVMGRELTEHPEGTVEMGNESTE